MQLTQHPVGNRYVGGDLIQQQNDFLYFLQVFLSPKQHCQSSESLYTQNKYTNAMTMHSSLCAISAACWLRNNLIHSNALEKHHILRWDFENMRKLTENFMARVWAIQFKVSQAYFSVMRTLPYKMISILICSILWHICHQGNSDKQSCIPSFRVFVMISE